MGSDGSEDGLAARNVEWTDVDDLNLDAADLSPLSDSSDLGEVSASEPDVFHDCNTIFPLPNHEAFEEGQV